MSLKYTDICILRKNVSSFLLTRKCLSHALIQQCRIQGHRKHLRLGGQDTLRALFSSRKRAHFLIIKRAFLYLFQNIGGTCSRCPLVPIALSFTVKMPKPFISHFRPRMSSSCAHLWNKGFGKFSCLFTIWPRNDLNFARMIFPSPLGVVVALQRRWLTQD